jgi:hypothetical protein
MPDRSIDSRRALVNSNANGVSVSTGANKERLQVNILCDIPPFGP